MEIKKNLTTQNYNAGVISRVKYIVIHYTANNGDTALGNTNYFKSYRGSSAHYFVDENNIYQSIEDKNIAWHCGANTYYHKECRNHNSIGVELCSYINSKGKYAFKAGTVRNAVWLVKQLMKKYNVPIGNVIRHYDVTHKVCPEPYVRDTKAWTDFKTQLTSNDVIKEDTENKEDEEMTKKITASINGKEYKVERILKNDKNYICVQDLEQAGFDIGYDVNTKVPAISNKTNELNIYVDDDEKTVEAILLNGRNYVQMRELAEAIGNFSVEYTDSKVIVKTLKNQ